MPWPTCGHRPRRRGTQHTECKQLPRHRNKIFSHPQVPESTFLLSAVFQHEGVREHGVCLDQNRGQLRGICSDGHFQPAKMSLPVLFGGGGVRFVLSNINRDGSAGHFNTCTVRPPHRGAASENKVGHKGGGRSPLAKQSSLQGGCRASWRCNPEKQLDCLPGGHATGGRAVSFP